LVWKIFGQLRVLRQRSRCPASLRETRSKLFPHVATIPRTRILALGVLGPGEAIRLAEADVNAPRFEDL